MLNKLNNKSLIPQVIKAKGGIDYVVGMYTVVDKKTDRFTESGLFFKGENGDLYTHKLYGTESVYDVAGKVDELQMIREKLDSKKLSFYDGNFLSIPDIKTDGVMTYSSLIFENREHVKKAFER